MGRPTAHVDHCRYRDAASFPIGVLLAIGRRSGYRSRLLVVYIELIRSVPLIAVVHGTDHDPIVYAANVDIDRVVCAILAFTVFSAAYMAENVRGGLRLPKGSI